MPGPIAIEDLVLNYGPEFPQERFCSAGAAAVSKSSSGCLPAPIPWPAFNGPTIWVRSRTLPGRSMPDGHLYDRGERNRKGGAMIDTSFDPH
jgi:hypothetical protein